LIRLLETFKAQQVELCQVLILKKDTNVLAGDDDAVGRLDAGGESDHSEQRGAKMGWTWRIAERFLRVFMWLLVRNISVRSIHKRKSSCCQEFEAEHLLHVHHTLQD
jgi:hypothetical protein